MITSESTKFFEQPNVTRLTFGLLLPFVFKFTFVWSAKLAKKLSRTGWNDYMIFHIEYKWPVFQFM